MVVLVALVCAASSFAAVVCGHERPVESQPEPLVIRETHVPREAAVSADPEVATERPSRPYDTFAGQPWCAPEGRPDCLEDAECPKGTKCIRPYYKRHRECTVPYPSKDVRKIRRQRLAYIGKDLGMSYAGRMVVQHVASRESTYRPTVVHGRDPDTRAAWNAWRNPRYANRYKGNPYYGQAKRWATLGQFGMNAALWVWEWDPKAPPSVLCLESVSYATYVRRMRRVWRKYNAGLECAPDRRATWWDLMRASSTGKLCPAPRNAKTQRIREKFVRFMRSKNLDPDRAPRLSELGDRQDGMNWAMAVEGELETVHPIPG